MDSEWFLSLFDSGDTDTLVKEFPFYTMTDSPCVESKVEDSIYDGCKRFKVILSIGGRHFYYYYYTLSYPDYIEDFDVIKEEDRYDWSKYLELVS